jgi:hypothetical protein
VVARRRQQHARETVLLNARSTSAPDLDGARADSGAHELGQLATGGRAHEDRAAGVDGHADLEALEIREHLKSITTPREGIHDVEEDAANVRNPARDHNGQPLLAAGRAEAHGGLERVVDPPLETSKGTWKRSQWSATTSADGREAVVSPIMRTRVPRPLVMSVPMPVSDAIVPRDLPLLLALPWSETSESAGCETMAQTTPAE